jgi:hypothetical protein
MTFRCWHVPFVFATLGRIEGDCGFIIVGVRGSSGQVAAVCGCDPGWQQVGEAG